MKAYARVAAVGALVAPLLLTGCSEGASAGSGPRVVASFYALQYAAERVVGEHASVTGLTSPGQEPHDLELSLRQTAEVEDADLVIVQSGFQPAVDEAVENTKAETVDATELADPLPAGDGHDPHFWLDPQRLAKVAAGVAEAMSDLDPENAGAYAANLAGLAGELDELDEEYRGGLARCARNTVVVSHDAFGYLGDRYGLDLHSINGLSPHAEPSPAHIQQLRELIAGSGVTTVFNEELASARMAQTLAGDLGLKTAVLDPIEGLSDETAEEDYLSLMRRNLAALREANDCS